MKIIRFLFVLSVFNFATASVPGKAHKQCASKVMKECACLDRKCVAEEMRELCNLPRRRGRRNRFKKIVRNRIRQAYCTPLPTAISGICVVQEPDFYCGKRNFEQSCQDVIDTYQWFGNCCSLRDRSDGGCRLTVNGPGSRCTLKVKGEENYFTYSIAEENDGKCPRSQYDVPIEEDPDRE
jgi:hypothetical protein